jgi:hypothetical protein
MNPLSAHTQLMDTVPKVICFGPAKFVPEFGEPLDSHDTFVLDLCELPIKPSKQRNRSIIFGE